MLYVNYWYHIIGRYRIIWIIEEEIKYVRFVGTIIVDYKTHWHTIIQSILICSINCDNKYLIIITSSIIKLSFIFNCPLQSPINAQVGNNSSTRNMFGTIDEVMNIFYMTIEDLVFTHSCYIEPCYFIFQFALFSPHHHLSL